MKIAAIQMVSGTDIDSNLAAARHLLDEAAAQGCEFALWQVGLSICYDLRFPELYRAYARIGADVLLVPSAFTHVTGQAHWQVLLRARAIENLAYVLAAGQGGRHANGRLTWGHSALIDPWGRVLDERPDGAGIACGVMHRSRIAQLRGHLPALDHRVL